MGQLRQIVRALGLGVAVMAVRPRHAILTASGLLIAGITLLVLLTIPAGLKRLAGQTGMVDVALVLPSHSYNESSGTMRPNLVQLIGALPGVAHTFKGRPMVAPQFVVNTRLRRRDGTTATVLVRGVTPMFWKVVGRAIKLRSGLRPRSGVNQLLAGAAAAGGFVALDTGATVLIHKTPWQVSGEFTAGGGFWESELWANMSALQATYNAPGKISSVWVKLVSPAAFAGFSKALNADARLETLQVLQQRNYYMQQTGFLDVMLRSGTKAIALALGIGAILATVNALGMALTARRQELAILRAIGFERTVLAIALVLEVLLIAIICSGIVALLGWLFVNGREVGSSTMSSAIQFQLRVSAGVVLRTFVYLLILGTISAAWPIWSALHSSLTKTLQDE